MSLAVVRATLRAATRGWLLTSPYSWTRLPVARDSPHVHAPGRNPYRILVTGDGASAGVGVLTHDLGLPGYLARRVSQITQRATDVDIVVSTDMTVAGCLAAIRPLRLSRFDVILLSLGGNEALDFMPPHRWTRDLDLLLDYIRDNSPAATRVIVLSIPYFRGRSRFPRLLQVAVDRHATRLNRLSRQRVAKRQSVSFLEFAAGDLDESGGTHAYDVWASAIAPGVSNQLVPRSGVEPRSEALIESARQQSLDQLGLVDMARDPVLDEITNLAQELFDTPMVGLTFIDNERQFRVSAIGLPADDIPRSEAFCDITIRRAEHFVIEDTLLDPRYSSNSAVRNPPYVRFYAGYPVETLDGHRVGALCIMDVQPRSFTSQDATLLRTLAHRAQRRLWALSDPEQGDAQ